MELQNFIDNNNNYLDILKSSGFKIKTFGKHNLYLIKYPYEKSVNTENYERYLKGCIIDSNTNRIVMVSPVKANTLNDANMNIDGCSNDNDLSNVVVKQEMISYIQNELKFWGKNNNT